VDPPASTVGRVTTPAPDSETPEYPPGQWTDYGAGTMRAAFVLAIVLPLVALVTALVLRRSETDELRQHRLRMWTILSGAFLWAQAGSAFAVIFLWN
jgi:hypothetical protein